MKGHLWCLVALFVCHIPKVFTCNLLASDKRREQRWFLQLQILVLFWNFPFFSFELALMTFACPVLQDTSAWVANLEGEE
jgi:hypothetical protein